MKKIVLFLIGSFLFSSLVAQDIIFKKNGEEIQAKVLEVMPELVKYKVYSSQDGPTYSIYKTDILLIKYEDGRKDIFNQSTSLPKRNTVNREEDSFFTNKQNKYFAIATGYGPSYGVIGVRFQYRFGDVIGYGFHCGIGAHWDDAPLVSAGVKFYPYKWLYVNAQFGTFGVGYSQDDDTQEEEWWKFVGPYILVGGDFFC